jgi:O-methyltransferase involved in polyketide biosynthesis
MKPKIKIELDDIQKTLLMPVWARAIESKKKKPILIDETAVDIMCAIDHDFTNMSQNISEISQISWIARCKRFDIVIRKFIAQHPDACIVNIGCGLDTTFERINDPGIHWYDLDLPEVIELRKNFVNESDHRKFIAASFLDVTWFHRIQKKNVLFISTGVFVYFAEEEIKSFLIKVADHFPGSELFFDVTSPKGLQVANELILKSGYNSSSCFKWGLKNKSIISSWDYRIKLINTHFTFKITGLHLSLKNKIIGLVSDFLRIQYMVHLRINDQHSPGI